MVIDQPVREFLTNIPARRHLLTDNHLAESPGAYLVNEADAIWRQITETLQLMTPENSCSSAICWPGKGLVVSCPPRHRQSGITDKKNGRVTCRCFSCDARQDAWPSRSAIKASALLIRSTLRDLPIAWTVTSSAGDCPTPVTATRSGIPTLPIPTSSSSAVA
ncbi:putative negative regulator [Klebsiella pneumoniae]|uniref:Putative negative regulator n=1 Tax=Klebsiella pneumoniae TaxID=573 RepID=A0A378AIU9_KLEPN|nr:putative negative regulator [Klebsiella pneumoniae]